MTLELGPAGHRGVCVAHHEGQPVFVRGGLPGERVVARVSRSRSRHAFAAVEQVLTASPDRVEAPCPYYGTCGGCHWQHAAYPRQLAIKEQVVREALERAGLALEAVAVERVGASDPWRYRWRGEFHRVGALAGAELGFTARDRYQRIPVADCLIHHPTITTALPALREGVRRSGREALTTLHLTVGGDGAELLVAPRPPGATDPEFATVVGDHLPAPTRLTTEATAIRYRDLQFRVWPEAFLQVNQGQLPHLYEAVVEWLGAAAAPGGTVVDAYAGIGILSCRLAQVAPQVLAIESNPVAARLCRLHAELNHLPNLRVEGGTVEEALPRTRAAAAVVLDPPRAGCAPAVTGWLALAGPPVVIYISCEPASLARDLHCLVALGPYQLQRLRVVDCFPQTYHVETVALLTRR